MSTSSYDHSDVAPYLRCYATSVQRLDENDLPMPQTHRLVCWHYYRQSETLDDQPVGIITPKGGGMGFEVLVTDPLPVVLDGEFWTRREAERALRFAAAGMEVPM